jgi:hypothetical protein
MHRRSGARYLIILTSRLSALIAALQVDLGICSTDCFLRTSCLMRRSRGNADSREDDDRPFHSQAIVNRANVGVDSGPSKSDPESRRAQRALWEKGPFLRSGDDEPRMYTVGRRVDRRLQSSVSSDGNICRRRNGIQRLGAECNSVRRGRIIICPLHCIADVDELLIIHETHDRYAAMPSAGRDCLANPGGHGIRRAWMILRFLHLHFGEQILCGISGLLVIESLIVRERYRRLEDMDHAGHIGMNQANQFVVARAQKRHTECLSFGQRRRADTGGAVEQYSPKRKPRTESKVEGQTDLPSAEEADCVNFVARNRPHDGVVGMNPNLVRQEGEDLPRLIGALRADGCMPRFSMNHRRNYAKAPTIETGVTGLEINRSVS